MYNVHDTQVLLPDYSFQLHQNKLIFCVNAVLLAYLDASCHCCKFRSAGGFVFRLNTSKKDMHKLDFSEHNAQFMLITTTQLTH